MEGPTVFDLLLAGDPRGLAAVYDSYADRLFAYCVSLLHDYDAAADAVHDTLLIARERAGQLRDPDRLRPWLYAIGRNECLRALRERRRTAALDEVSDVTDESVDMDSSLRSDELRELVWSAAASLNPGEREILELSVRHGLEGADLADALGVSANHASAHLSRARTQLERALSALILARTGREECTELDGMLADWDGRLTPLLRKRLVRHLERCPICGEQRRRRVSAGALLAGVPFVFAPPALRRRVIQDAGDMNLVAMWERLTRRAGPWRPDGFPVPAAARRRRVVAWWSAAAGVAAIILLVIGVLVLPGPAPRPVAGQALAPGTSALGGADTPTPAVTPEPIQSTTIAPATAAAPDPTQVATFGGAPMATMPTTPAPVTTTVASTTPPRTTTPAPMTTTPAPPPPPTITLRAAMVSRDCGKAVWTAQFYADIAGAQAKTAVAHWYVDPAAVTNVAMAPGSGTLWTATATGLPTNVAINWYVTVTVVDGAVTTSATATTESDCPPPG